MFAGCCCAKPDGDEGLSRAALVGVLEDPNAEKGAEYEGEEEYYDELQGEEEHWEEAEEYEEEYYEDDEYEQELAEEGAEGDADGEAPAAHDDAVAAPHVDGVAAAQVADAPAAPVDTGAAAVVGSAAAASSAAALAGSAAAAHNDVAPARDATSARDQGMLPVGHFTAKLRKRTADGICGWQLDTLDQTSLYISDILGDPSTPVQMYNATVAAEQHIRRGDYITVVNEETAVEAMSRALRSTSYISVKINRPILLEHTVPKGGKGLGLDLKYSPNGTSLLIERIRGGAVEQGKFDVKPLDRIIAVGGEAGNRTKLLSKMKEMDPAVLYLSRCPNIRTID